MPVAEVVDAESFKPRQRDVLEAALRLLVEEGDALTMNAVARRASCSKETLYKWFGDRDGLLDRDGAVAGVEGRGRAGGTRAARRGLAQRAAQAIRGQLAPGDLERHLDRA